jgi:hypothetical protein
MVRLETALISAITMCAGQPFQKKARKFLQGLSKDELQYIAEFLGACILEPDCISQFERIRRASPDCFADQEHKMILLREYLRRIHLTHDFLTAQAGPSC